MSNKQKVLQHVDPPPGWEVIKDQARSVDELCQQLFNFGNIGWMYRGESRFFPTRTASLGRHLSPTAPNPIDAECSEIAWFQTRAHAWLNEAERSMVRDDLLAWLTLMQHHHAPTRLLDWTFSPWVAAYHAAATFDRDYSGFIWAFNPSSYRRNTPKEWSQVQEKFTAKTVYEYRKLLEGLPSELVLPFNFVESTMRMVAQQGVYTFGHPARVDHAAVIGCHMEAGEAKILIFPNNLKREMMERMRSMNLTAASLFPGLDGVGKTTLETMRMPINTPWGI